MPDIVRVRVVVSGAVQGVGFRYATREEAVRLGLCGFVRNDPDGTVEAEAQGERSQVERLTTWLAHGPHFARVDGVEVEEVPAIGAEQREAEQRGAEHRGAEHRGAEHRGAEHRGAEGFELRR